MMSAATASSSSSTGLCIERHTRPSRYGLLYDFCSSVQEFFRQFLPTPGFFVAAHIGRTAKNRLRLNAIHAQR